MSDQKLLDLPASVIAAVSRTLDIFVRRGPAGVANVGLFRAEDVVVAEERCGDFGGQFRMPPADAPVHVYVDGLRYDLDLPLWVAGEDSPSELFIFLEVDSDAAEARMVDLRAP